MKKTLFISLILFIYYGCGIYTFTGANYGNAKTVSIKYFENLAPVVNPQLSQMFYDKLTDKFVSQSPLQLVEDDGDLQFQGKIIGYDVKPIGIQAGETAASNRLTVTVRVKFINKTNPKNNFDRTFSWYADYSADQNLAQVEDQLIDQITDKIVEDIFNAAVVNW